MRSLHDSRILITGASSGIGRALAVRLAEEGGRLFLTARRPDALDDTAHACRKFTHEIGTATGDVASQSACSRLIETAVSHLGGLDILVCNAGVSMWSRVEDIADADVFEYLMRVNYLGAVYLCREALPHLRESRGMIVGVSSLAARTGVPFRSGYSASKAALTGFLEALRIELEPAVKVLIVFPGLVATGFRAQSLGPDGSPLGRSPRNENKSTMSIERCVELIVGGIRHERREVVMTLQARIGLWLKIVAPRLVDAMAKRAVMGVPRDLSGDTPDH